LIAREKFGSSRTIRAQDVQVNELNRMSIIFRLGVATSRSDVRTVQRAVRTTILHVCFRSSFE